MPTYNVHIYREMKLRFDGIEADTHEAAAAIARDKATDQADSIDDCEGENLAALVDVVGDEEFSQSVTIDFEPERERKAAGKLLEAARMVVDRWEHGDLAEAARACSDAIAEAEMALPPPANDPAGKPYSVLLRYPDYANDGGNETYYAFVTARDPSAAVAQAQRKATAAQVVAIDDPADFAPLLVTEGHHYGQPVQAPPTPAMDAEPSPARPSPADIVLGWSVEDVRELRPDLTADQCREVLHRVEDRHDASFRIDQEVIGATAEELFPEPKPAAKAADAGPVPSVADILADPKRFLSPEQLHAVYRDTVDSRMDNDPLVIELRAAIADPGPCLSPEPDGGHDPEHGRGNGHGRKR